MSKIMKLVVAAGLPVSPAVSQVPVQPIGAPPFVEIRSKVVQTAGGELLGLVDGDLGAPVRGTGLVISGLQPADRTVCVSIRHASGAYAANFTVRRAVPGATLRFVLPPNHIAELRATRGELAILARVSGNPICSQTDPVLPASWGDSAPTVRGFALVNDHQALRTQVVTPDRPPSRCARLSAATLTAYQVGCDVDFSGPCGPAILTVQFIDGTSQSTLRTPFRRPC